MALCFRSNLYILHPYYENFKKKLIKSPKLYFYDTGLARALLGIREESSLIWHPLQGRLSENVIIVVLLKRQLNCGIVPKFYFWRESNGLEVDYLIEDKGKLLTIEIKSPQTFTTFSTSNLNKLTKLIGKNILEPYIIYGVENTFTNQGIKVVSRKNLNTLTS